MHWKAAAELTSFACFGPGVIGKLAMRFIAVALVTSDKITTWLIEINGIGFMGC
jgi:hypothetical protein